MATPHLYRITFMNQGQVYEIYARAISHAGLLGFLEVEQLVFGEKTQVIVDPSEERLKTEFEDVERTYIPVHAVLRIDQVKHSGHARIRAVAGSGENAKVMPFPVFTPGGGKPK
ncbi:MAG: DUF1820 family protein [Nevskiaceae bacterium]|nr:MAG: DUF1820 family protein [Nevskiaceae bacterium]TBR71660.1 MAG: DUF1820 family protein [Nevskiaceae bacterium]